MATMDLRTHILGQHSVVSINVAQCYAYGNGVRKSICFANLQNQIKEEDAVDYLYRTLT